MKKVLLFILALVFVFSVSPVVMADGIGDDQISNYPGVVDYRDMPISPEQGKHQRPYAGFSLQIRFGVDLSDEVFSGAINSERNAISSSQDSPVIQARVGDSIVINDRSTPGSGSKITQYDIQYRFTPEGQNREDYEIHPAVVSSWSQVKNIIENLPLDQPGTYEIYMAVADDAPCLPGATNWSANGNVRSVNVSNPNFPGGIFWYFTCAVVEVTDQPGLDIGVELTPRQPYWQIPSDLGYVHPMIDINFSANIDDHQLPIFANGYKEAVGIKSEDFEMIKHGGEPPMRESFSFKVTQPGKYIIRAGIPTEDESGNPILFEVDEELQPDVNPANNHAEIEIEVGIGPPSQIKTEPDIDTDYVSGDHIRGDLTG